ncbi:MAG: hypothetical protein JWR00_3635 [Rubritepida sp.]|nr:hypothetical protein [Rubritepida sp.]
MALRSLSNALQSFVLYWENSWPASCFSWVSRSWLASSKEEQNAPHLPAPRSDACLRRGDVVSLSSGEMTSPPLPSRTRVPRLRSASGETVRVQELPSRAMPDWADPFLVPEDGGDIFASRFWYDAVLGHALPADARTAVALIGEDEGQILLPLLRGPRGLRSLATPYTLEWRPLSLGGDDAAIEAAGRGLGAWLRHRAPMWFEALDLQTPLITALARGVAASGVSVQPYRHFGNWHEKLPPGQDWEGYLDTRAPVLRTTIRRKLKRAGREFHFELVQERGATLERGITAYEAVRAGSWKPSEPFPHFDAALMRAAAAGGALRLGVLRLGVLRDMAGQPVAAQYWLVSGGRAWLLKLCHLETERAASPGTALTALMIQGLIDRDGVRELDFGRGDDRYKRLWVSERRQRMGLVLAHAGHPQGLMEVARHRVASWLGRDA